MLWFMLSIFRKVALLRYIHLCLDGSESKGKQFTYIDKKGWLISFSQPVVNNEQSLKAS